MPFIKWNNILHLTFKMYWYKVQEYSQYVILFETDVFRTNLYNKLKEENKKPPFNVSNILKNCKLTTIIEIVTLLKTANFNISIYSYTLVHVIICVMIYFFHSPHNFFGLGIPDRPLGRRSTKTTHHFPTLFD